ncbi:unnamed protein product [Cylicostephanus goldi]|uniref:Uncharacterized protein n=1 Tax=Cylicostephanus goldi TaxID=71465 RepID=A0A3P6UCD8_CYLGO|nr:unnamed protein product [Cylicostephanus goldi]
MHRGRSAGGQSSINRSPRRPTGRIVSSDAHLKVFLISGPFTDVTRESYRDVNGEKEIPRRCLVIKRNHPEPGVERTELRLVTYQKSGTRLDQAHILMDAARYLQERADDADYEDTRRSRTYSRYYSSTRSSSGESGRSGHYGDQRSGSSYGTSGPSGEAKKAAQLADRKKLRETLENLVAYFARRADDSGDREWSVITGIAERLLFDVSECIQTEQPISHDMITRIRGLKKLARQATFKVSATKVWLFLLAI